MTAKTSLCEAFIVTSWTRAGNLFHTGLRLLGMLGGNVIVQCLLRRRLVTAVLTLMFEGSVVIRLVMHVHRRLLRSYKGTVRADILTVGVFLIYVHHGGTYLVPPGHFQFLEMPLCLGGLAGSDHLLPEKLNHGQNQMTCPLSK